MTEKRTYGGGSLVQRTPGVWRLRAWKPDPVTGEPVQSQRTFKGTEAKARKALAAFVTEGAAPPADRRTFGQLLDDWVAFKSGRWSPKTLDEARREIENRIRPRLGASPVAKLTAKHLDDAYAAWGVEGLSDSSVHRHAAVISAALTQGVKWGWLEASPAPKASAPVQRTERKLVTPTPEMVGRLIRVAEESDPVMAAAVALAFVTGGRRGELCALRWSDIDLEVGSVRIERSLAQVGEEVTEKGTKTDRERTVALDPRSAALLRRHRQWQSDLADRAESHLVDDPFVLSDNANGAKPVPPSKITDRFTALRARAKIRGVRFHDLRHAHVTQLLGAGVDATTVAHRVGHASTRMTLDRYAHALPAGDVAAAGVIGALLPEVDTPD
jgi:integrase